MKKLLLPLISFVLVLFLAACNQTAAPVSDDSNSGEEKTKTEEKKAELTLKEVYEKSAKATENLKSMHSSMTMNQEMTMPGEEGTVEMESAIDSTMVMEPLAIHQIMDMSMVADGATEPMENMKMESYLTEEGFFMKDNMQNKWVKMPKEYSEQILQMSNAQTDPSQQLKDLEPFMDDFTFEQDDNHYILTLNAEGDKFNELLESTMKEVMPEMLQGQEEILQNMQFDKVQYEIFISKDTFYTTKLNSVMDMTMKIEDNEMKTKTTLESDFDQFNEVNEIKVPKEVAETAEEISL
jgi:hypothetical protein